ncbi:MAG: hypothetical protein R3Y35_07200 [Clostridia bacterium]
MDRIEKLETKVKSLELKVNDYIKDTNLLMNDINNTLVQLLKATLEYSNLAYKLDKTLDKINERIDKK